MAALALDAGIELKELYRENWRTDDLEKAIEGFLLTLGPTVVELPDNDGPFPPDGFRWKGDEFRGLSPIPWRLLNYIWAKKPPTVAFSELADPVWNDREVEVTANSAGSVRRQINRFFPGTLSRIS